MVQKSHSAWQGCIGTGVAVAMLLLPVNSFAESEIDEWTERWRSELTSVVTAKVTFRHLRLRLRLGEAQSGKLLGDAQSKALQKSLDREQIHVLFQEKLVPLVGTEGWAAAMKRETDAFLKVIGADLKHPWLHRAIIQDGLTLRNDDYYANGETSSRVRSSHGELEYHSEVKQALIVDEPSQVRLFSVKDIHFIPAFPRELGDLSLRLGADENGFSKLVAAGMEIRFDTKTAIVSQCRLLDGPGGSVKSEIIQLMPKLYSDSVLLPVISARFRYARGADGKSKVKSADVFVIESAVFNEEISADDFKLGVPKGVLVVNDTMEHLKKTPVTAVVASEPIRDITQVSFPVPNATPGTASSRPVRSGMFYANLVTAAVIAAAYLFRHFRHGRRSA